MFFVCISGEKVFGLVVLFFCFKLAKRKKKKLTHTQKKKSLSFSFLLLPSTPQKQNKTKKKQIPVSTNKWKRVGMVAGGTGITPMYQVLLASFADPSDKTTFSLIYGSRSSDDIILKKELDELAQKHKGRLDITYLVDKAPLPANVGSSSSSKVGYVDAGLLKKALPKPSADSIVMVCGPPPMMVAVSGPKAKDKTQGEVEGLLKELGYKPDNVFKF